MSQSRHRILKRAARRLVVGLIACSALLSLPGCSDPLWMVPGRALSGEVKAVPDIWQEIPETIQLETRPDDPYSINIWGVSVGRDLYVATADSKWMPYIAANPLVKVRIDGVVYKLSAAIVTNADERVRVNKVYASKYDLSSYEGSPEAVVVYRLDRR